MDGWREGEREREGEGGRAKACVLVRHCRNGGAQRWRQNDGDRGRASEGKRAHASARCSEVDMASRIRQELAHAVVAYTQDRLKKQMETSGHLATRLLLMYKVRRFIRASTPANFSIKL